MGAEPDRANRSGCGSSPLVVELRGEVTAVAAGLDRLLLRADVGGVVEHAPGRVAVAVSAEEREVCRWLAGIDGLDWRMTPEPGGALPTGLEADEPILIGPNLLVRPPWVASPAGFEGIELVVPRGMAFGSGEHGSTQAALLALEASWPEGRVGTFADVGAGSGVLALYARARGAERILACDLEEPAVRATRDLLPGGDVRQGGPAVFPAGAADAVVANLDDAQLEAVLPEILRLWSGRGPLVLSGVRASCAGDHARRVGPVPDVRVERGGFVALGWRAERRPSR